MAENDDVPGSPDRDEAAPEPTTTQPVIPAEPAAAPILKTRWRDRAWTFRAMLAVAAASLVIGGIAGGVVASAAHHDDHHGRYRMGPWGPGGQVPPGWQRHGHRNFNGPGGGPMMPYGNDDGSTTPAPQPSTPATPTPSG